MNNDTRVWPGEGINEMPFGFILENERIDIVSILKKLQEEYCAKGKSHIYIYC